MALDIIKFIKGIRIKNEADTSKELELAVSASATTGTKTTLVAAQTADITITLPISSTTVVGEDTVNTLTNKTINADNNTITNIDNNEIKALAAIDATKIANGSVDNTEFQYLDGATSNIQGQLTAIAGSAITALTGDVTATGPGSVAATLATVNATPGTTGSATQTSTITTNAKGLVTNAVNTTIAIPASAITTTIPISGGGTGQITQSTAFDALSPNTTKGDITVRNNASTNVRLPVGIDGQILVADSSQTSGLAYKYISGVKNYVTNGDAESNTTTGWTRVANTTPSARPEVTPGGTPDLVNFVFGTGAPGLRGNYCFTLSNIAGASRQGEQVRYDFTIDTADKAKVLNISFDYRISTGSAYAEGVGLADSDIIVYIVDRTNGTLIEPTQYKLEGYGISQQERNYSSTFQTSNTSTQYSLVLYKATANTGGFNINLDTVVIGPLTKSTEGTVVAARASLTGTQSIPNSVETEILFNTVDIDTTNSFNASTGQFTVPSAGIYRVSVSLGYTHTTGFYFAAVHKNGANVSQTKIGANPTDQVLNNTTLVSCVAGDILTGTGFQNSGSAQNLTNSFLYNFISIDKVSSSEAPSDGKIVATAYGRSALQSISDNTLTTVNFDTIQFDKTASFNTGTSIFTVPETGIYEITAAVGFATSSTGPRSLYLGKNGNVVNMLFDTNFSPSAAGQTYLNGNMSVSCVAGDQLYVTVYQNSGGALNIGGDPTSNFFNVIKVNGASSSASSNTSVVFDTNSGSPSGSISGATSLITFTNTPNIDSMASYNTSTGLFVVPIAGSYRVSGGIGISGTYSTGQSTSATISKNGTAIRTGYSIAGGALSQDFSQISLVVRCNAGDTLALYAASDATTPTINANGAVNFLSIERIGN